MLHFIVLHLSSVKCLLSLTLNDVPLVHCISDAVLCQHHVPVVLFLLCSHLVLCCAPCVPNMILLNHVGRVGILCILCPMSHCLLVVVLCVTGCTCPCSISLFMLLVVVFVCFLMLHFIFVCSVVSVVPTLNYVPLVCCAFCL